MTTIKRCNRYAKLRHQPTTTSSSEEEHHYGHHRCQQNKKNTLKKAFNKLPPVMMASISHRFYIALTLLFLVAALLDLPTTVNCSNEEQSPEAILLDDSDFRGHDINNDNDDGEGEVKKRGIIPLSLGNPFSRGNNNHQQQKPAFNMAQRYWLEALRNGRRRKRSADDADNDEVVVTVDDDSSDSDDDDSGSETDDLLHQNALFIKKRGVPVSWSRQQTSNDGNNGNQPQILFPRKYWMTALRSGRKRRSVDEAGSGNIKSQENKEKQVTVNVTAADESKLSRNRRVAIGSWTSKSQPQAQNRINSFVLIPKNFWKVLAKPSDRAYHYDDEVDETNRRAKRGIPLEYHPPRKSEDEAERQKTGRAWLSISKDVWANYLRSRKRPGRNGSAVILVAR